MQIYVFNCNFLTLSRSVKHFREIQKFIIRAPNLVKQHVWFPYMFCACNALFIPIFCSIAVHHSCLSPPVWFCKRAGIKKYKFVKLEVMFWNMLPIVLYDNNKCGRSIDGICRKIG